MFKTFHIRNSYKYIKSKLEITLIFPDQPIPVYVGFSSIGFCILDEGDLLDYLGMKVVFQDGYKDS